MKRMLALVSMAMVAGCGGGSEQKNGSAAGPVNGLQPGQYEVAREVTASRSTDNGTPQINAPVGTRTTESICVGEGEQPTGELFAGAGSNCSYGNFYMRNGRINSSLTCRRDGLNGELRMTADGSFTADSFEANVETTTYLSGDGDSIFATRTTGRRTGECQAGGDPGNSAGGNAAAAQ